MPAFFNVRHFSANISTTYCEVVKNFHTRYCVHFLDITPSASYNVKAVAKNRASDISKSYR